jgi:hypothetical protein
VGWLGGINGVDVVGTGVITAEPVPVPSSEINQ